MTTRDETVPFSAYHLWCKPSHFPLVSYDHSAVISKIVDDQVLKEPNSKVVNYPIVKRDIEPIGMTWGQLYRICKENSGTFKSNPKATYRFSLGEGGQIYRTPHILSAFRYLPKRTMLTIYADHDYPLEVIFEHDEEKWVYRQAVAWE
jgi:hypothetical protein